MFEALLWFGFAALVIVGALRMRARSVSTDDDEPWRASLYQDDDEPLDIEEIRQAEEEWLEEEAWSEAEDDEPWR